MHFKKAIIPVCSILLLVASSLQINAQKYFTKAGHISFHSETPIETIEAHNYKATSILDLESGAIEFAVLIKAFTFEKALMQEHFNENYMESDEYPKSKFKGSIQNLGDVNFNEAGSYDVKVAGYLTIHGVTQPVEAMGTLRVSGDGIAATSEFVVSPADYKIAIPKVVTENIAKEISISVDLELKEFKR